MNMTGSMHGPTLARDDRSQPSNYVAVAHRQATSGMNKLSRAQALHSGSLLVKAAADTAPTRRGADKVFHSGHKRPRTISDAQESSTTDLGPSSASFFASAPKLRAVTGEPEAIMPSSATASAIETKDTTHKRDTLSISVKSYMDVRVEKLHAQAAPATSNLFEGMCVYVDGRTGDVSGFALTRLIHKHGGATMLGAAVSRITHIVAENLNASKTDFFLRRCGTRHIPVLHPRYFTDCARAKRRLPEAEYWVLEDARSSRLPFHTTDSGGGAALGGSSSSRTQNSSSGGATAGGSINRQLEATSFVTSSRKAQTTSHSSRLRGGSAHDAVVCADMYDSCAASDASTLVAHVTHATAQVVYEVSDDDDCSSDTYATRATADVPTMDEGANQYHDAINDNCSLTPGNSEVDVSVDSNCTTMASPPRAVRRAVAADAKGVTHTILEEC